MIPVKSTYAITTTTSAHPSTENEDLIISLKALELFLYANCKNDNKSAKEYLQFLLDLNRYEDAYRMAVEISEFLPEYKRVLATFAVYLEDENIVRKHINNFTLAPDAPDDDWLSLLVYHHVSNTIDELLSTHPLPKERHIKAVLYYFANDDFILYTFLSDASNLCEIEEWLLWVACCRLELENEKELYLNRILSKALPLPPHYFKKDILLFLSAAFETSNRDKIIAYLQLHLKKNPGCLMAIQTLVSCGVDPIKTNMFARLRRLLAQYPSVENKNKILLIGQGDKNVKLDCLVSKFKTNPINKNLFVNLYHCAVITPETQLELISNAIARSNSLFYQLYFVTWKIKKLESHFNEEDALFILRKIDDLLLERAPNYRIFISYKAYILALLKRTDEAITAFKSYIKLFGCTMPLIETIDSVASIMEGPFVLCTLEKGYRIFNNCKSRDALIRAYILHNNLSNSIDGIRFIVSTLLSSQEEQEKDFESIELLLTSTQVKQEGHTLIDSVPRTVQNLAFIIRRSRYYSDIGDLKACADIEFIKKYRPHEAKKLHLTFLANSKRCVEAAQELLISRNDISDELIEVILTQLFNIGENSLMDEVYKKTKPRLSHEARTYLAQAYYNLSSYQEALPIYKILISENPLEESYYIYRASCYESLKILGTAIDVIESGLEVLPESELLKSYKQELLEKQKEGKNEVTVTEPRKIVSRLRPTSNPEKIPHLIQDSNKERKKDVDISPKAEKIKKNLQKSPAHAVNPLADPLAVIKKIARIGETQTGLMPTSAPAPEPVATTVRTDAPKAIVKITLSPREKVFIKRGLDALNDFNQMKVEALPQSIIFRNQIYTILRVFIPLRLNTINQNVIEDLIRIRDDARHLTDQLSSDRLSKLFNYLRTINLASQMNDWVREKSIITRLFLKEHVITVRRPRKTPAEKVIEELEFILNERGEKGTWKERLYHRNAIKASLSIIGEASNKLPEELKNQLKDIREAGNTVSHEFFEKGDTVAYLEKYKEEDISPDELWDLTQNSEILLKTVRADGSIR